MTNKRIPDLTATTTPLAGTVLLFASGTSWRANVEAGLCRPAAASSSSDVCRNCGQHGYHDLAYHHDNPYFREIVWIRH